jgi:S-adenosylhomocysteine hydrolase
MASEEKIVNHQKAKIAREEFVKRHPAGKDDQKVPVFHEKIAEKFNFSFKPGQSKKIAFIVVAHFVHSLPYFLEMVSKLGDIVALIPKQSDVVKKVRKTIESVYQDIIHSNINKESLKKNQVRRTFLVNLSKKFPNHSFIILDHGGYFSSLHSDYLGEYRSILGIVEHTWNGEVKYNEQLLAKPPFCIPVRSIARSKLKDFESEAVARSIVSAIDVKIFSGEGLHQDITRLNYILIMGYGHIGKRVAIELKIRLKEAGEKEIYICDVGEEARKKATIHFLSDHITDDKLKFLSDADLIITATSTQVFSKKDFNRLKKGAVIVCATSSDDQFTADALEDYKPDASLANYKYAFTKYIHKTKKHYIYLASNGGSVNFLIGSTPNPIIHAILASVCVNAYHLIAKSSALEKIHLSDIGSDGIIKKVYEDFFGPIKISSTLEEELKEFRREKNLETISREFREQTHSILSPSEEQQKISDAIFKIISDPGKAEIIMKFIDQWQVQKPDDELLEKYLKILFEDNAKTSKGELGIMSSFEAALFQFLENVYIKTPEIMKDAICSLIENDKKIVLKYRDQFHDSFSKASFPADYKFLYEKLEEILKDHNMLDEDDQKDGIEKIMLEWVENNLEKDVDKNMQDFIRTAVEEIICPNIEMRKTFFNENKQSLLIHLWLKYKNGEKFDETTLEELFKFLKWTCKKKIADEIIENWLDNKFPEAFKKEVFKNINGAEGSTATYSAESKSHSFRLFLSASASTQKAEIKPLLDEALTQRNIHQNNR